VQSLRASRACWRCYRERTHCPFPAAAAALTGALLPHARIHLFIFLAACLCLCSMLTCPQHAPFAAYLCLLYLIMCVPRLFGGTSKTGLDGIRGITLLAALYCALPACSLRFVVRIRTAAAHGISAAAAHEGGGGGREA